MVKKTVLEKVYEKRVAEVDKMSLENEHYAKAVDSMTKLADRVLEEKKFAEERKSRWFKDVADVTVKVLGVVTTVGATILCLRFEENGSLTTTVGRKWTDKILKN